VARNLTDPEPHEMPVVEITVDVAAAQAALTGARHPSYFSFGDAWSHADNADRCWRCDAAEGETDVGLCAPCHQALVDTA
jgi:hypothetical protein